MIAKQHGLLADWILVMVQILVIEDDESARDTLQEMLSMEGYKVILAENASQGILAAKAKCPELILCDIEMPDLDGYQVFEELHNYPSTELIPFIFLTGRVNSADLRTGMNLGADDYLTKPWLQSDLLLAIQTRLARYQHIIQRSERKASDEKEAIIRQITHELEHPINNMKMAKTLILQLFGGKIPKQVVHVLDTYQTGTNCIQRMIEQMILLLELESGTINRSSVQAASQDFKVNELLLDSVKLGHQFAPERRHIELRMGDNDITRFLHGCPKLLKHALGEIVANALDFSLENRSVGIKHWVSQEKLFILVMNEGLTIPTSEISEIFQPFYRLEKDQSNRRGLGIGLSLAQQIVYLHQGNLRLLPTPTGTSALIQLPVR